MHNLVGEQWFIHNKLLWTTAKPTWLWALPGLELQITRVRVCASNQMQESRKGLKTSGEVSTGAMGCKQLLGMQIILWASQCVHWNMLMSSVFPSAEALFYALELATLSKYVDTAYPESRPPMENLKGREKEVLPCWLPPPHSLPGSWMQEPLPIILNSFPFQDVLTIGICFNYSLPIFGGKETSMERYSPSIPGWPPSSSWKSGMWTSSLFWMAYAWAVISSVSLFKLVSCKSADCFIVILWLALAWCWGTIGNTMYSCWTLMQSQVPQTMYLIFRLCQSFLRHYFYFFTVIRNPPNS